MTPVRTGNPPRLPQGFKLRYCLAYNKANPLERRKFIIGSPLAALAAVGNGSTIAAEDYPGSNDAAGVSKTWVITSYRGEKVNKVPAFDAPDTGLTDGTTSQ